MDEIVRFESNQRMSRVVKAAGLVIVGGQTSDDRTLFANSDAILANAFISSAALR